MILEMITKKEAEDDPVTKHWHLDKRVNVTHLLATVTLAASMFAWAASIDRRLSLTEQSLINVSSYHARQDYEAERNTRFLKEEMNLLRQDIKDQTKKIDRILESGGTRK